MENLSLTPLDRGFLWLMRIHGLVMGFGFFVAAFVGEFWIRRRVELPWGLLLTAALLLLVYLVLWAPPRRYRAWGYGMDGEELQVRRGVWTRVHTVVPLARVQHIDVSQGPMERLFGICSLVLHTAGTMHSQIVLPGLTRAAAEGMRDEIRNRIREEPA